MVNMSRFAHSYDLGEAVALYHSLRMKPVYLSKEAFGSLQAWLASSFCDNIENAPTEISTEVLELAKYKILTQNENEAVSYTHLDVYKRQAANRASARFYPGAVRG